MKQPASAPRLYYLDALRAIALFCILMVHCHDRFNFWLPDVLPQSPPSIGWILDGITQEFLYVKSALLFSLLFGISFALQMHRSLQRGYDFRGRFAWRLCLLFGFGLLHSLFYCGDILMIFAVLGFIPLLCWRIPLRWTFLLSLTLLLNPIALWNDLMGQTGILLQYYQSFHLPSMPDPSTASWGDLAAWNISYGSANAWLHTLWSNRLCPIIGMFLLGLVIGKSGLLTEKQDKQLSLGLVALLLWLGFLLLKLTPLEAMLPSCINFWCSACYVCAFAALLCVLLRQPFMHGTQQALAAMGKMTLSCYLSQSLIMCFLLAGWGMGLLLQLNPAQLMGVGLLLYLLQLSICILWLKRYRYGPAEALWRRGTNIGLPHR